jgi:Kef-type K+ transport system membrane component KefB
MAPERMRALMIALFAVAALLSGIGNSSGQGWVIALAFSAFAAGVIIFGRWRRALRAKVFDREEKTTE